MTEVGSYRTRHSSKGYGEYYRETIERGYHLALWTEVEGPLLREHLASLAGPGRSCLDFACGTGRITRAAAEYFEHVEGIDISPSMLAAAEVPPNVQLQLADFTTQPLNRRYDVITAFRFFLNAEDSLRREALRAIHAHLADAGRLVCNVHMNSTSPGGLATTFLASATGSSERGKVLGRREFIGLLTNHDFEIEEVVPYGYLPYVPGPWEERGRSLVAGPLVKPAEKLAGLARLPGAVAQYFLVVAKRA
jgi:SAM-dependent methyltransferase